MLAYHSDQKIKDTYLNRVKMHREADQLVKGSYWSNGKGCAVGCTIHGDDHGKNENPDIRVTNALRDYDKPVLSVAK